METGFSSDLPMDAVLFFRPKPSPFPLVRIGGDRDGAYLVPDVLHNVQACFSPGVSNRKTFEDELLVRYGISSHMMDFSSDIANFQTPLVEGKQTFTKKWLSPIPGRDNVSLPHWVARMEEDTDNFLLQMDIEGAEYLNLLATPSLVLKKFLVMVIEFHGLVEELGASAKSEIGVASTIEHLASSFVSVHARANNCRPSRRLGHGLVIPDVLEVTFMRKDYYHEHLASGWYRPMLPHPLDIQRNCMKAPPMYLSGRWRLFALSFPEFGKIASDANRYYLYLVGKQIFRVVDRVYGRLSMSLKDRLSRMRRIWNLFLAKISGKREPFRSSQSM